MARKCTLLSANTSYLLAFFCWCTGFVLLVEWLVPPFVRRRVLCSLVVTSIPCFIVNVICTLTWEAVSGVSGLENRYVYQERKTRIRQAAVFSGGGDSTVLSFPLHSSSQDGQKHILYEHMLAAYTSKWLIKIPLYPSYKLRNIWEDFPISSCNHCSQMRIYFFLILV